MDKKEAVRIAKKFAKVVVKYFQVKSIILYGSYAKNNFREHSDIDIAVIVDKINEDFLKASSLLFKLRHDIDNRIEPVLLEEKNDVSGFLESIKQTGKIITPGQFH